MTVLWIILYMLGFVLLLILTQNVQIFPGAFISKMQFARRQEKQIPPGVESFFLTTPDKVEIEVWRHEETQKSDLSQYIAIVFHGNGGPVENFIFTQMWLGELGIASYGFDYRGFGRSCGWPSEKGMYTDSDTVVEHVLKREEIDASKVIIVGISVGSAPAARAASLHGVRLLILSSAFTDLRSAARAQPLLGWLAPFVWYQLPTKQFVSELGETHLLLARGMQDRIVPPDHSSQLLASYRGSGYNELLSSDVAGHNMTFFALKDELKAELRRMLNPS